MATKKHLPNSWSSAKVWNETSTFQRFLHRDLLDMFDPTALEVTSVSHVDRRKAGSHQGWNLNKTQRCLSPIAQVDLTSRKRMCPFLLGDSWKMAPGWNSLISIDMRKQHCLANLLGKCEGENAFDKCMQNTCLAELNPPLFFIKLWCTGMFYFLCDICCFTKLCDVAKLRVCAV